MQITSASRMAIHNKVDRVEFRLVFASISVKNDQSFAVYLVLAMIGLIGVVYPAVRLWQRWRDY